jgi:hypothetical protein
VRLRSGLLIQGDVCFIYSIFFNPAVVPDWCDVGRVTIDMLPDVALLGIFERYMDDVREDVDDELTAHAWYTLVHVCQKWRSVVFGSPRRLDIRLFCTDTTPVKETLAIWPLLPIVIERYTQPRRIDNIIMALEHNDRVRQIVLLELTNSQLGGVLATTQRPFPTLTDLTIWLGGGWEERFLDDEPPLVVPESFLGGSAPRLQSLQLERVPFPGLPKLLLPATGLVSLYYWETPHSGYISPEAMVRCVSTLTGLESLKLGFKYPLSRPVRESRRPHPPTRSILPALISFEFEGVSEYLEDLVTRIDAPLLQSLGVSFFHQLTFDTPRLAQFVARTPNIQPPVEARITFSSINVAVACPPRSPRTFVLAIRCIQSDWQLSSLTQVCSSSFPQAFIPTMEHLYICEPKFGKPRWQDDIEHSQWREVLHPFTAVKYLYISREFASCIAPALQELAGEVLPSIQKLFLEDLRPSGPVQEAIEKFVAARQLAGHPIAVSHWYFVE